MGDELMEWRTGHYLLMLVGLLIAFIGANSELRHAAYIREYMDRIKEIEHEYSEKDCDMKMVHQAAAKVEQSEFMVSNRITFFSYYIALMLFWVAMTVANFMSSNP